MGTTLVNDLLIGFNDSSNNQRAARLARARQAEQPARHSRGAADPGPVLDSLGQRPLGARQRRDGDQQHQRGVSDQRAADVAARPAHAEVRRVVELLPESVGVPGQQRPEWLHRLQRVQLHGRSLRRLPAGPGVAEGARLDGPPMDPPAASHRPVCRRRLQGRHQPHVEPWSAVGLHIAVRREGRPSGQLRSVERADPSRWTGRQQPGVVRAVLQRVGAAARVRVSPGRALGVPRRVRHHAVHGRDGRQPAAAAQPAVLLRIGRAVRRHERRPARSRPASRVCRRSIAPRARSARGIRSCGRSSRSSGTCSPSTCSARGLRSTSGMWATSRRSS